MFSTFMSEKAEWFRFLLGAFVCVLVVSLVSFLQNISYDLSAGVTVSWFMNRKLNMHLFGCGFTLMLTSLALLLTGRLAASCMISSLFCAAFSILNHYVNLYHGQPFTLTMIAQAGTALEAAGRYSFSIDRTVAAIAGILLLNMTLCFFLKKSAGMASLLRNKRFLRVSGLCCAVVMISAAAPTIDRKTRKNTLNALYWLRHWGYIVWALTDSYWGFHSPLRAPEGYSADEVRKLAAMRGGVYSRSSRRPDIILILNESLFDLRQYTNLETDAPYLENWYAAANAFRGHALSPYPYGGTNDSEYELHTGYPSSVIARRAPMTWMDTKKVHSDAAYLKALGYQTWAVHSCSPQCYNRHIGWPALGFQHRKYYRDFKEHARYGNRRETDAANYRDMIRWYERAGKGPRFFFMLTIQNHGDFKQNDDTLDTVHSLTGFGKLTPLVNEYLTSIRMSDEALGELLAYFEGVKRPVLVCVVGDHAPSFIRFLRRKKNLGRPAGRAMREVPLLIWANSAFGPLQVESAPVISMGGVMPLVLKAAGLPLSPYYEYLLDTARDIPIRDTDGTYVREDGTRGRFEPGDENYERLLPLYSAAYADLAGECAGVLPQVFLPPRGRKKPAPR